MIVESEDLEFCCPKCGEDRFTACDYDFEQKRHLRYACKGAEDSMSCRYKFVFAASELWRFMRRVTKSRFESEAEYRRHVGGES